MKRFIVIAFAALGFIANLQAQRCVVCNLAITGRFYLLADQVTLEQRRVCERCARLDTKCYLCGLPAKDNLTRLKDGRVLCARDSKGAVLSTDEARQVCYEARTALDRLFSRYLTFPSTNVTIAIADRVHMEQLFKTPGFDNQCRSIFGYITSRPPGRGEKQHSIILLSGLPRARLMATYAHEMAHAWLNERLRIGPQIDRDAVEGFCELVAFKLMGELSQDQEQKVIRANLYTRGQLDLFRAADNQYGFYAIMDWMKAGLDSRLSETDLDQIRKVQFEPRRSTPREIVPVPAQAPTPVPDTLTLIGVSGTGGRRLALIDDRAFTAGESANVRVGKTNAVVHCLEIRNNSVLIEVDGSGKQELFLKSQ